MRLCELAYINAYQCMKYSCEHDTV